MRKPISLSLSEELVIALDTRRGWMSRSIAAETYIRKGMDQEVQECEL